MSVFTTITQPELESFLTKYAIGSLTRFSGIEGGVTNTIYLVETTSNKFILTLFEELAAPDLPFYIDLTSFLAEHGLPCANTIADKSYQVINTLKDKPALIQEYLPGETYEVVNAEHCAQLGTLLGKLHNIGQQFTQHKSNPRGLAWRNQTAQQLFSVLDDVDKRLLESELEFQRQHPITELPSGIIHADIFRDNVLFNNSILTGIIDFYYACNDALLLDVAITANDWCLTDDFVFDPERLDAFLEHYNQERKITKLEQENWPVALRLAALRFWLSRMQDFYFPPSGDMVYQKDPDYFKNILLYHRSSSSS